METPLTLASAGVAAIDALIEYDKQNIGTDRYLGLAWWWPYEMRHEMRDASEAQRRRAHDKHFGIHRQGWEG